MLNERQQEIREDDLIMQHVDKIKQSIDTGILWEHKRLINIAIDEFNSALDAEFGDTSRSVRDDFYIDEVEL